MSNSSLHDISELQDLLSFTQLISAKIEPGSVLALQGELGSGKTTFTQCLLKELGITDSVTSPTFTIMNQYETEKGQLIYHLDLYRLRNKSELELLGLEEMLLQPNIVIIEWPELALELLPPKTVWLQFKIDDQEKRTVETFNR